MAAWLAGLLAAFSPTGSSEVGLGRFTGPAPGAPGRGGGP